MPWSLHESHHSKIHYQDMFHLKPSGVRTTWHLIINHLLLFHKHDSFWPQIIWFSQDTAWCQRGPCNIKKDHKECSDFKGHQLWTPTQSQTTKKKRQDCKPYAPSQTCGSLLGHHVFLKCPLVYLDSWTFGLCTGAGRWSIMRCWGLGVQKVMQH